MKNMRQNCKNLLFVCGLWFSHTAFAQAPPLNPGGFDYRVKINLSANGGPFYQVALPLQIYQSARRPDLGDLRVFNGEGEVVPHTLIRAQSSSSAQEKKVSVPVFPITQWKNARIAAANPALTVQRKADGTLIIVSGAKKPDKTTTLVQGAILDISQVKERVRTLRLETGPSEQAYHEFSIDASDDMQQWQPVLDSAQLIHLRQGGQSIDKDSFDLDGATGKYLRILWREPASAPAIISASVATSHTVSTGVSMLWSDAIPGTKAADNIYDYRIPSRLPLEQVRIGLPQANTLAPLQVQCYLAPDAQHQHGAWETLAQTVVYRLQSPHGELRSPDLVLNANPVSRLRLLIDAGGGGIGNAPATLRIGFTPRILVFLARGQGPFTLAWGARAVTNAVIPPQSLLPNYNADTALAASPAALEAVASVPLDITMPTSEQTSDKRSQGVLWTVLAAGLLVLAGMVLILFKQMRQAQPKEK